MNETTIKAKLDKLANYRAQIDSLTLDKQALIDRVLTDEIKAKLADIEAEFTNRAFTARVNAAELEDQIRQDILAHGASVKGKFLHAIWAKGRVTWDTKGLVGYAVAHPEMSAFRSEGEPTVSLRNI